MRLFPAVAAALLVLLPPIPARAGGGAPAPQRCGAGGGIYDVAVPGAPMSATATPDEQTVFVSLNSTEPRQINGIAVLRCTDGRYRLQRVIPLESQPAIAAFTHDGKMLVVPGMQMPSLHSSTSSARCPATRNPVSGFIEDVPGDDGAAIDAAVSPDDRFAFVAEEQSGKAHGDRPAEGPRRRNHRARRHRLRVSDR